MHLSGQPPLTWMDFKKLFIHTWMSSLFEVDVVTAWKTLSSKNCITLDEYVNRFCEALHAYNAFRLVTLFEQVETFCCGLPKELRDYCIKNKVQSMTKMVEIAQTGYDLCIGKMSALKSEGSVTKSEDKERSILGSLNSREKGSSQSQHHMSLQRRERILLLEEVFLL